MARSAQDSCRRTCHTRSRSISSARAHDVERARRRDGALRRRTISSSTRRRHAVAFHDQQRPGAVGATRSPTYASTARSESPSISSSAAGTTPAPDHAVTAVHGRRGCRQTTADNAARAGGFGTSRSVTSVMIASVPSEPTSSCVRS